MRRLMMLGLVLGACGGDCPAPSGEYTMTLLEEDTERLCPADLVAMDGQVVDIEQLLETCTVAELGPVGDDVAEFPCTFTALADCTTDEGHTEVRVTVHEDGGGYLGSVRCTAYRPALTGLTSLNVRFDR